jgi:hypothetical protein
MPVAAVGGTRHPDSTGSYQAQMQGYEDRSKYRAVVGTKYARELILIDHRATVGRGPAQAGRSSSKNRRVTTSSTLTHSDLSNRRTA